MSEFDGPDGPHLEAPNSSLASTDEVDPSAEADRPTAAAATAGEVADSNVVPRIGRRRRFRINANDLIRIGLVGTLLVGIIMMRKPCADGVANFVTSFDEVDAGVATTPPSMGDLRRLTDEEIRAAFRGDGDLLENDRAKDAGPDAAPKH